MSKRITAAAIALVAWIALVWFTAWDRSPSDWSPDLRLVVAMIGLGVMAFAATCPLFDED